MIVNDPAVLAEVIALVDAYEAALMTNDVAALDGAFWASPHTVRLGVAENLWGFDEIAAFRVGRTGGSFGLRRNCRDGRLCLRQWRWSLHCCQQSSRRARGQCALSRGGRNGATSQQRERSDPRC